MREAQFREWFEAQGYDPGTVRAQVDRANRLARAYGDLDPLATDGGLERLQRELAYSKDDERVGKDSSEMPGQSLTREAVEAALDEFDTLGSTEFLAKYERGLQGTRYWVKRGNKTYPSKAIANAALGKSDRAARCLGRHRGAAPVGQAWLPDR